MNSEIPKRPITLVAAFRRNLMIGMIALAPVALTVWIVTYLFGLLVTNRFTRGIGLQLVRLWPYEADPRLQSAISHVTAFLLITLGVVALGYFVRSLMGRRIYRVGEHILERIPVVNRIYLFIRQIAEAVFTQRKTLFREVVMIEYPRKGIFSLAFVTAHVPPAFGAHMPVPGSGKLLALFVPTTPNPTSGFLMFVREDAVQPFPAATSEAMSLILSGGTMYPGETSSTPRPRLLDLLQESPADAVPAAIASPSPMPSAPEPDAAAPTPPGPVP